MNKCLIALAAIMSLLTVLPGCYYDVEEELYPNTGCDTLDVGYATTIAPIIEDNCLNCHNAAANFGNVTLEGHNNLKTYAGNGQLLGVIRHESGFPAMPQGAPQLVDCTIEKIEKWVNDGAPDN